MKNLLCKFFPFSYFLFLVYFMISFYITSFVGACLWLCFLCKIYFNFFSCFVLCCSLFELQYYSYTFLLLLVVFNRQANYTRACFGGGGGNEKEGGQWLGDLNCLDLTWLVLSSWYDLMLLLLLLLLLVLLVVACCCSCCHFLQFYA